MGKNLKQDSLKNTIQQADKLKSSKKEHKILKLKERPIKKLQHGESKAHIIEEIMNRNERIGKGLPGLGNNLLERSTDGFA
ncbi:hypothetical protein GOY07_00780 [Wolbachia endosymbiont of Litomosoides sigmodontis]|nr:hypothetical protein GOY07_00780 [Wolbachia endosymbiont of Litomosoides sigmodontis]